jgi:serine/threonine protein phosphatase PrpC
VSWASLGDAALVLARPGAQRGRQLNKEAMRFIGQPMTKRAVKKEVQRGGALIEPGEWLVAITDGLSEFVAPLRPADVVPRVLATLEAPTAEVAARTLINTACSAGAGDNVAAAVVAPS